MVAYPDCHNLIKKTYKLSESTFYRLREATKNDMKGYSSLAFKHDNEEILNKIIHQKLIKIIEPPQFQMNINIIHQKLWEEISWEISRKRLRHIMKHQLRYSYIKGDPRPLKVASSKHIMTKGSFWTNYLNFLKDNTFILNIDESSFSRHITRNYSWLPTGSGGPVLNATAKGKWNLVMGVFPNGSWICFLKNDTMSSYEFAVVLFLISKLLKLNSEYSKKTLTILLDNASIHKSSLIFKVIAFLKIKLLFLPPYSPELAAVELLFKGVKSITRKLIKQKLIDFSKEDGAKVIMEASSWISKRYIQSCWISTIIMAKEAIKIALIKSDQLKNL